MLNKLQVDYLGRLDYEAAWELQKELVAERSSDEHLPQKLLLLEHPPTYTLGRSADERNVLLDEAARAQRGISLYYVDRGGDVTYHGPGQLVGYPILYLSERYGKGIGRIRRYVNDLEQVLISTLAAHEIPAQRFEGKRGVWVREGSGLAKIAAIGVYVNRAGVTSHGFALNVDTDLSYFQGIVPCGIGDHGVTSMNALLRARLTITDIIPTLVREFGRLFDLTVESAALTPRLIQGTL